MTRDTTYNDLSNAGDTTAGVEFVMDEEAFHGFYERHARGVWAYLVRLTCDRLLADDLLQDTFYRFLKAAATHESDSHRRNSLYAIATNVARDARRRRLVRLPFHSPHDPDLCAGSDPSHSAGRSTDLERAMQSLKPRERALLWLAYAEGATYEEIAAAVGVRRSSLKSLLFRARRRLAGLLGVEKGGSK
jgi:RNA polymerase sigma-70 factor (ECF subfamily)